MIKIFIAEDQPLILRDICQKIMRCGDPFEIIGEATNGKDAYEKIMQCHPDVIFTDIRMPLMDGLNLIEKVKLSLPDIKCIIISGYKDFDYARAAMKLNVDEYLLKPILFEDIEFVLNQLKLKVSINQESYEKEMLNSILNASHHNHPRLHMPLTFNECYIVLLNAGPFAHFTIDYLNPFGAVWDNLDIENLGENILQENEKIYIFDGKTQNEKLLFIGLKNTSYSAILHFLKDLAIMFETLHAILSIAVSKPMYRIDNIGIESQVLRTLMKKNILFGQATFIECSHINPYLKPYRTFISSLLERKFILAIQNHQKKNFIKELELLIDQFQREQSTQYEITKTLKYLVSLFNKVDHPLAPPYMDIELEIEETLSNVHDYHTLKEGILFSFTNFLDAVFSTAIPAQSSLHLIDDAKHYIDHHFNESFTINDLASRSALTPAYFSRLFKERLGVTPIEYLTQIRIQKACDLILSHNYTFKEIAELCGYSDQFYFSRTFKMIIGKSPSQYKVEHS
ncbi:response regulator transcription factor [Niameybacter massiliensis]|uniref:response regulator transcription factor n=1 Tax=Niameybacter massiliensis TaxID=1658108 RepID=UPI0006B5F131|nr:AraC family transcriptional regulator [Niameybacter massiliensis]